MTTQRISRLLSIMNSMEINVVLVHSYENRRYFSGFTGSNGYLLITDKHRVLITDQRYTQQAKDQAKHFHIITYETDAFITIQTVMKDFEGISSIGFESKSLSVQLFRDMRSYLPNYKWVPMSNEFLDLRKIKELDEIAIIRQSIELSDNSFSQLIPKIHIGMTEKEVAVELEYLMGKNGHDGPAFGTIVASGIRAAFPHAEPSNHSIVNNHFLLIDFGIKYKGYMSDMTRTMWIGSPNEELKKYYEWVQLALEQSVAAVKPGITGHELDAIARNVFERAEVEEYSLRGLGHGVGLQIHEQPRIVLHEEEVLQPGMVFTIEPGLYVPGLVGVRVEDVVLVTENGCEILTKTPRHIQI